MKELGIIVDEIKNLYKLILLGILIATTIMSVAVVFLNLTGYIMPAISRQYDSELEDGVSVHVQNLPINNIDILNQSNAKNIKLVVESFHQLSKSKLKLESSDIEISGNNIQCQWLMEEDDFSDNVLNDVVPKEFNYSDYAIVYCSEKEMANYSVGRYLTLYLKNGTYVDKFRIEAVKLDKSVDTAYVILPSLAVIRKMENCGVIMEYSCECIIEKASEYVDFKNTLAKYGASCKCDFDEMLNLVSILTFVFQTLTVIFIVISVFVIAIISVFNINVREKFIILQKILGATDFQIIAIYFTILELQIFISNISGYLLGLKFTKHLLNEITSLYGIKVNVENSSFFMQVLTFIIISNLALAPLLVLIKKIIRKKDVVSIINNKD